MDKIVSHLSVFLSNMFSLSNVSHMCSHISHAGMTELYICISIKTWECLCLSVV